MIDDFNFSGKPPLREDVFSALNSKPKLMERKSIFERVSKKVLQLVEVFDN